MNDNMIVYDLAIVPDGLTFEQIVYIMKRDNLVLYDSTKVILEGFHIEPKILNKTDKDTKILIDISTEKGRIIYDKIIKEMEKDIKDTSDNCEQEVKFCIAQDPKNMMPL